LKPLNIIAELIYHDSKSYNMVTDVKLTVTAAFSCFTLLIFSFPKLYFVRSPLTSWARTKHCHCASAFPNVTCRIIWKNICVLRLVVLEKNLWNRFLQQESRKGVQTVW